MNRIPPSAGGPAALDAAALARSLRLPPSALRIVDLSALDPARREGEAGRWIGEPARPALELPPRLRVRVEGLSSAGEPPCGLDWLVFAPEPPPRRPDKVYESPLEYWGDRALELPPPPALPAAGPGRGRSLGELDAETWSAVRERAARAGLAPAVPLLAAFADTLAAWCEEARFTVDLGLSGSPAGLWIPLALDGAAPEAFEERAFALQERLRRDLAWPLPRSLRGESLPPLPVAVALPPRLFRQGEAEEAEGAPGRGRRERAGGRAGRPRLRLQAAEREGGLLLLWDLDEPGLPDGMYEALTGAFRDRLRRLSTGPAWREARRRVIPPQQLARMVALNTTGSPLPVPYLWEMFAERARRQPERPAVSSLGGAATYGELLRTAQRLGHLLQREGAQRNAPVAVALEPGPEAVAALLGVLAAGAAWIALDPGLPRERFRALLERGRVGLAVTREGLAGALDWPEEIVAVLVEDLAAATLPEAPPAVPSASPKDLACIAFGPEGGVMLENRGVANLLADLGARFGLGPEDRTLALSPLSSGAALFEVFGTLAAGGTVVFPGEPENPAHLARQLAEAGITVLAGSPALVEELLAAGCPAMPRVLLLSGGEAAPDLPARVRRLRPGARVARLRGCLEATVWTAVQEVGERGVAGPPPFGRPLSNQTVHVLDGRLELRPFGVPGDLYVGGLGLARGCWRDPARSAALFTLHPDTGERLLRTGARARWLPSGEIELVEREG